MAKKKRPGRPRKYKNEKERKAGKVAAAKARADRRAKEAVAVAVEEAETALPVVETPVVDLAAAEALREQRYKEALVELARAKQAGFGGTEPLVAPPISVEPEPELIIEDELHGPLTVVDRRTCPTCNEVAPILAGIVAMMRGEGRR